MAKIKIVEIGQYPPPNTGWSVRIKQLRDAFLKDVDCDCKVLRLGKNKHVKIDDCIEIQGGADYIIKLFRLRMQGYIFHLHMNANAVKGPLLVLAGLLIAVLFFKPAVLTFHGGMKQIYFPRQCGGKMYWLIYINFLLAGTIICNDADIKEAIAAYGLGINKEKIHPIPAFSVQYLRYTEKRLPEYAEEFLDRKKNRIVSYVALREGFFLEVVLDLLNNLPEDTGGVILGVGKLEDESVACYYDELLRLQQEGAICIIQDLDHDQFMSLLSRSHIYFRPCMSDGVSSSVLEALALAIPVVACDNGRRPAGVITYKADDVVDMKEKVFATLDNHAQARESVVKPNIEDTVQKEVQVIKEYIAG